MASSFQIELLQKKWIHSHEEDNGSEMVYRPSTYEFPMSRGRSSFELAADGTLMTGGPGPDDRQSNKIANWELEDNTLVFKEGGSVMRKLRILSLNKDKLVVADG